MVGQLRVSKHINTKSAMPSPKKSSTSSNGVRNRHRNNTNTITTTNAKPSSFSYPERREPNRPADALQSQTQPTPRKTYYVFVYGTAKRGFAHGHFLDRATYLGDFRTVVRYPLVIGSQLHSPYLLDMPHRGAHVKGEVYAVDDAILADLDHFGAHLSRKIAKVSCITDRAFVVDAFVYFKVDGVKQLLDSPFIDDYQGSKYVAANRYLRHGHGSKNITGKKTAILNMVS